MSLAILSSEVCDCPTCASVPAHMNICLAIFNTGAIVLTVISSIVLVFDVCLAIVLSLISSSHMSPPNTTQTSALYCSALLFTISCWSSKLRHRKRCPGDERVSSCLSISIYGILTPSLLLTCQSDVCHNTMVIYIPSNLKRGTNSCPSSPFEFVIVVKKSPPRLPLYFTSLAWTV